MILPGGIEHRHADVAVAVEFLLQRPDVAHAGRGVHDFSALDHRAARGAREVVFEVLEEFAIRIVRQRVRARRRVADAVADEVVASAENRRQALSSGPGRNPRRRPTRALRRPESASPRLSLRSWMSLSMTTMRYGLPARVTNRGAARMNPAKMPVAVAQPVFLVEVLRQARSDGFRAASMTAARSSGCSRSCQSSIRPMRASDNPSNPFQRSENSTCAALEVPFPDAVVGALDGQRVAILQLAHALLQRLAAGLLLAPVGSRSTASDPAAD